MTGGMSTITCYTKFNFDFPYVRLLSLRCAPYMLLYLTTVHVMFTLDPQLEVDVDQKNKEYMETSGVSTNTPHHTPPHAYCVSIHYYPAFNFFTQKQYLL